MPQIAHPHKRKPGAPKISFPGSIIVSRQLGVTHGHLYRVLTGERQSERVLEAYRAFIAERGLPWPKAAKVKPAA